MASTEGLILSSLALSIFAQRSWSLERWRFRGWVASAGAARGRRERNERVDRRVDRFGFDVRRDAGRGVDRPPSRARGKKSRVNSDTRTLSHFT